MICTELKKHKEVSGLLFSRIEEIEKSLKKFANSFGDFVFKKLMQAKSLLK